MYLLFRMPEFLRKGVGQQFYAISFMNLYYDNKTKKEEIYNLYQLIFNDPKSFADYYFSEMYKKNRCLLLEENGEIGAMLHQNPYEMKIGDKEFSVSYIVAVATRQELRRQGCMRKLLVRTLQDLASNEEPFTYLMPARREYYEPFDFAFIMDWYTFRTGRFGKEKKERSNLKLEMQSEDNISFLAMKMNEMRGNDAKVFTKMSRELLERLEKEQNCEDGHIFLIRERENCVATGMYTKAENAVQITNLFVENQEKRREVIRFLREEFSSYEIEWTSYHKNLLDGEKCEKKPLIMARILRVDILLPLLKATKEQEFIIDIRDTYLDNNNGSFLWKMTQEGSFLERTNKKADVFIDISRFTEIIFGYAKTEEEYLKNIVPLSPVHITEVV